MVCDLCTSYAIMKSQPLTLNSAGRLACCWLDLVTSTLSTAVAALAHHGDQVLTSDPTDLSELIFVSGQRVDVIPV
jgi:hypothetical protein